MLYAPLPKCYKKMFPFKLSTTSYIYPDHILPNVAMLAPYLDEIELVLFESKGQDNLPHDKEVAALIELSSRWGVRFNVHLPIDIFLGSKNEEVRASGVSIAKKVIERTLCLDPSLYTLHFDLRTENGQNETDIERWRKQIIRSAREILESRIEPERISIETLGYPFEWVEEIVRTFGFSICLDIGHILISGQDLKLHLERLLPEASVVHFHGIQDGVDHVGIDHLSEPISKLILFHLRQYHGIVSMEVFSIDDLKRSLLFLEEKWPEE